MMEQRDKNCPQVFLCDVYARRAPSASNALPGNAAANAAPHNMKKATGFSIRLEKERSRNESLDEMMAIRKSPTSNIYRLNELSLYSDQVIVRSINI